MDKLEFRQFETIRTTITLPAPLAERTQEWVDKGAVPNRNALIVAALERFLADLEREEIDRQFAAMADDEAYRDLSEELEAAFADSDWEIVAALDDVAQ